MGTGVGASANPPPLLTSHAPNAARFSGLAAIILVSNVSGSMGAHSSGTSLLAHLAWMPVSYKKHAPVSCEWRSASEYVRARSPPLAAPDLLTY